MANLLILFFLLVSGCGGLFEDKIEKKCNLACDLYNRCISESSKNPPVQMLDSVKIQCVSFCTMEQSILECFNEQSTKNNSGESNSCKKYASCIYHTGIFME